MKRIRKLLVLLIFVLLNSSSNNEYYALGHIWNFNVNDLNYVVKYLSSTTNKITLQVENTESGKNELLQIYVLDNDEIKYVTINEVEYKQLSYGKYYGGAILTGTYEIDIFIEHITAKDSFNVYLDIIGIYYPPLLNPVHFHYFDLRIK